MEQLRTTIRLRADLLKAAKHYALEHDTTFTALVEAALEEKLARRSPSAPFKLITSSGKERPGIDISNNEALRNLMDGL